MAYLDVRDLLAKRGIETTTDPGKGVQSLRTTRATRKGIKAARLIKRGHVHDPQRKVMGEIRLLNKVIGIAAKKWLTKQEILVLTES